MVAIAELAVVMVALGLLALWVVGSLVLAVLVLADLRRERRLELEERLKMLRCHSSVRQSPASRLDSDCPPRGD